MRYIEQTAEDNIRKVCRDFLFVPLFKPLNHYREFLKQHRKIAEMAASRQESAITEKDKKLLLNEILLLRRKTLETIGLWDNISDFSINGEQISLFEKEFEGVAKLLPPSVRREQDTLRFTPLKTDPAWIRYIKKFKRAGLKISRLPGSILNFFRRRTGKKALPPKIWKQEIPVQRLAVYYLRNQNLKQLTAVAEEVQKKTANLLLKTWKLDEAFFSLLKDQLWEEQFQGAAKLIRDEIIPVFDSLDKQAESLIESLESEMEEICNRQFVMFESQCEIAGTFEFNRSKHSARKTRKGFQDISKRFLRKSRQMGNTLFALTEDWKFNHELYILNDHAIKSFWSFQSRMKNREEKIRESLERVPEFLKSIEIENLADEETFRKKINLLKYQAAKEFSKSIIPETEALLSEHNFSLVIQELEQNILSGLEGFPARRTMAVKVSPEKGLDDSSLHSFSPKKLIGFEVLPHLKRSLLTQKALSVQGFEDLKNGLTEVAKVTGFNLDTALVLYEQEGQLEEAVKIGSEGIQRALEKSLQLNKKFSGMSLEILTRLEQSVEEFCNGLTEFQDNQNIAEVRLRLLKASTLSRGQRFREAITGYFHKTTKAAYTRYRLYSIKGGKFLRQLKGRLGVHDIQADITTDISDFLVAGDAAIKKLPFVYRRLFHLEPLNDNNFFYPRNQEMQSLNQAFTRWKNDSFVPILMVGEKGSGITSMINLFIKEKVGDTYPVFKCRFPERVLNEEQFFARLGIEFCGEPFQTANDFFSFIDKNPSCVVVLDGLQKIFLRQPGGFMLLKKFFEIVSLTSRKIFWVCSCSLYASRFLDKTIGLYGYFPAIIKLRNLTSDDIVKLITLRHNASGFNMVFEPSPLDRDDRQFQKLSQEKKQEFLKDKYFSGLNELTRSNIAFAILLWVRSASKVTTTTIHIRSLDRIDFSFLQNLPQETLLGLYAMIIHESLNDLELSQVININRRQANLMLMRLSDRGIIQENSGQFSVNPLLYRITVELLKAKNIIH